MPWLLISSGDKTEGNSNSNIKLLINSSNLYYLIYHSRMCSNNLNNQIVDLYCYETNQGCCTVYSLHNLNSNHRTFIITKLPNKNEKKTRGLRSISEIYSSSWWLEREASEMHGVVFEGKKDLRNLMLQYGDSTSPFKKNFPSVGTRELLFDSTVDQVVQVPISLQL
jgi:NADH:ubiquinone oxidoreductase subunit C